MVESRTIEDALRQAVRSFWGYTGGEMIVAMSRAAANSASIPPPLGRGRELVGGAGPGSPSPRPRGGGYPPPAPACSAATSAVITCASAAPYRALASRGLPVLPCPLGPAQPRASCAPVGGSAQAPSAARGASERAFGEIGGERPQLVVSDSVISLSVPWSEPPAGGASNGPWRSGEPRPSARSHGGSRWGDFYESGCGGGAVRSCHSQLKSLLISARFISSRSHQIPSEIHREDIACDQ